MAKNIYERLGLRTVINGSSWETVLGGSIMAPEVVQAMADAVPFFVDMAELNKKAGEIVARVTGAEAGLVTSGASAALVLAAAACMTGNDDAKAAQLPDTTGLKNEIIIQTCHRNRYDGAFRLSGARLVEVGIALNTAPWELEGAINERTAAIAFVMAPFLQQPLPLRQVVEIAHRRGIPVIVDAAAEVPPAENLTRPITDGADLVAYSGGKGIGGPQSTGFLCGRSDLVAAAELHSLNYHSPRAGIGRPMKVCKEEVIGLITALEIFERTDQKARWRVWKEQAQVIVDALQGIPGVRPCIEEIPQNRQGPVAVIYFESSWQGPASAEIQQALRLGDQPIYVGRGRYRDELWATPVNLQPGEEHIVAERLRKLLMGR